MGRTETCVIQEQTDPRESPGHASRTRQEGGFSLGLTDTDMCIFFYTIVAGVFPSVAMTLDEMLFPGMSFVGRETKVQP